MCRYNGCRSVCVCVTYGWHINKPDYKCTQTRHVFGSPGATHEHAASSRYMGENRLPLLQSRRVVCVVSHAGIPEKGTWKTSRRQVISVIRMEIQPQKNVAICCICKWPNISGFVNTWCTSKIGAGYCQHTRRLNPNRVSTCLASSVRRRNLRGSQC